MLPTFVTIEMRIFSILSILFLLVACQTKQENGTVLSDFDSNKKSKDTAIENKSSYENTSCFGHGNYHSFTKNYKQQFLKERPGFSGLASFNFFYKHKKIWDANNLQAVQLQLPKLAVIIESEVLQSAKNRSILIWMVNPKINFSEDTHTCGERTIGVGQFLGRVNISLVDNKTNSILNTIAILEDNKTKIDECFPLPFLFYNDNAMHYLLEKTDYKDYSKVKFLHLEDYNNDGKPHEFCFYYQSSCNSVSKTMFSYDDNSGRIYNYPIVTTATEYDSLGEKDTVHTYTSTWVEKGFKYPSGDVGKVFAMSDGYMSRGEGLPICRTFFDKKTNAIYNNRSWYTFKYVINNKEKFDKYFTNEE